jgi:hypothetical protein
VKTIGLKVNIDHNRLHRDDWNPNSRILSTMVLHSTKQSLVNRIHEIDFPIGTPIRQLL